MGMYSSTSNGPASGATPPATPATAAVPAARSARWLDPDSLDVCAWAETGCEADDGVIEPGDTGEDGGDDLETPPPSFQTQQRR